VKRRIVSLLAAISLLLCATTAALWTYSYWHAIELTRSYASYTYDQKATDDVNDGVPMYHGTIVTRALTINRGSLSIATRRSVDHFDLGGENVKDFSEEYPAGTRYLLDIGEPTIPLHVPLMNSVDGVIVFDRFGFFFCHCSLRGTGDFIQFKWWDLAMPMWAIAILTGVVPGLCACAFVRLRHRLPTSQCLSCGYSLTGNTSGTCPECGSTIPQASRPA